MTGMEMTYQKTLAPEIRELRAACDNNPVRLHVALYDLLGVEIAPARFHAASDDDIESDIIAALLEDARVRAKSHAAYLRISKIRDDLVVSKSLGIV
jgi:hypothetical protein